MSTRSRYQPWFRDAPPVNEQPEYEEGDHVPPFPVTSGALMGYIGERSGLRLPDVEPPPAVFIPAYNGPITLMLKYGPVAVDVCRNCRRPQQEHLAGMICRVGLFGDAP